MPKFTKNEIIAKLSDLYEQVKELHKQIELDQFDRHGEKTPHHMFECRDDTIYLDHGVRFVFSTNGAFVRYNFSTLI